MLRKRLVEPTFGNAEQDANQLNILDTNGWKSKKLCKGHAPLKTTCSSISLFHDDLIRYIVRFVDIKTAAIFSRVCKRFRRIILGSKDFTKMVFNREFAFEDMVLIAQTFHHSLKFARIAYVPYLEFSKIYEVLKRCKLLEAIEIIGNPTLLASERSVNRMIDFLQLQINSLKEIHLRGSVQSELGELSQNFVDLLIDLDSGPLSFDFGVCFHTECTRIGLQCSSCGIIECDICGPICMCEFCEKAFCVECRVIQICEECSVQACWKCASVEYCSRCDKNFCESCSNIAWCDSCQDTHCFAMDTLMSQEE